MRDSRSHSNVNFMEALMDILRCIVKDPVYREKFLQIKVNSDSHAIGTHYASKELKGILTQDSS